MESALRGFSMLRATRGQNHTLDIVMKRLPHPAAILEEWGVSTPGGKRY